MLVNYLSPQKALKFGQFCLASACLLSFSAAALDNDPAKGALSSSEPVLDLRPGDEADICDDSKTQIRTLVNGVKAQGILVVEVYANDSKNFLETDGRLRRARVAAEDGSQEVCLDVPGPGIYAVASYHDQDGDRKFDKKWNRMPDEPFALSNNPKLKLRKPRFKEAAIETDDAGAQIVLNLRGTD